MNQHTQNKLTDKQENFCVAYVRLGDKTAAFREAYGDKKWKAQAVHEQACKISVVPKVVARINELQAKAKVVADKKFDITAEKMLRHLNILREARIDDYIILQDDGSVKFKPFSQLSPEQLMCIEGIKQTKYGVELKLHGKEWCIEKINKHIGFYERDNAQKTPPVTSVKVEIIAPEDSDG